MMWAMRHQRRRTVLVMALLAGLTGGFWLVWWHSGESTSAAIAAVAAAVLTLAVPLVGWAGRQPPAATATDWLSGAAEQLATTVRLQWEREADVRQLRDPQPLVLRWVEADPTVMDHIDVVVSRPAGHGPSRWLPAKRPSLAARTDRMVEKFCQLPRRRLVVIGEPGAGKTAVLVLLTLGLLERWRPEEPVPVLLSLSSWNPLQEALAEWLPRQLSDEYPFLRRAGARALVDQGRVLPLLDGLDELPGDWPAHALKSINRTGPLPLVVACRSQEFERAVHDGDVLTGGAVVELEPIRPEQAADYLRLTTPPDDRLARWEPVFAWLRREGSSPLAMALSTPLMVSLARSVYAERRAADPAELLDSQRLPTVITSKATCSMR